MTLLSRSTTSTVIKPQMTPEPFRWTSALRMKLISSSLTLLFFIYAVYSAALREGSDDLLRFLKDAFEMNPNGTEPLMLSETYLAATERILDPGRPTDAPAGCKASEIVLNAADFTKTTAKPNMVEQLSQDVFEERSIESSNSDGRLAERASAEDSSREEDSYKRLQLRTSHTDTHKALQEHYGNSAESMSVDRTDIDADATVSSNKQNNKDAVIEDISSQEMDTLEENGRYRPSKAQRILEKLSAVVRDGPNLESHPIIQSFISRERATDYDSPESMDTPDRADSEERDGGRGTFHRKVSGIEAKLNQATVDNSREVAECIPGCSETSGEHPMEENNSLDAPGVDPESQKDTVSHQNQPRKICLSKRARVVNNQLDLDSPERVNSELQDRDNSRERLEDHMARPL